MAVWDTIPTTPLERITPRIKDIIENYSWPEKYLTVDQYIANGTEKFFDFQFPWYDPENKAGLAEFKSLFLHKYYMRCIGQETEALFKLNVQSYLMEVMPRYTQLFESTQFTYDPLTNRKVTRKRTDTITESKTGTITDNIIRSGIQDSTSTKTTDDSGNNKVISSGTNHSTETNSGTEDKQSIHSDNPQISASSNDYASTMDREQDKNSGTSTTDETNSNTNTNTFTSNKDENFTSKMSDKDTTNRNGNTSDKRDENKNFDETETGFIGESMTDNILKYREAILNLNEELVDGMKRLFLMYYV